jgi:hypothetical protein
MTRTSVIGIALLALTAAGCGSSPSGPSPTAATTLAGTWSGAFTDSTTASLGTGGMMGERGMGMATLQLTQDGQNVRGTMTFAGMPGNMTRGAMTGTMSGDDMIFTMDMPAGSMMSGNCSVHVTGTAHANRTTMTMTGEYKGTNSCAGSFENGHMDMSRK